MSDDYDINNIWDAIADWKERRPKKELPTEVPTDAPPIPAGPQTLKSYDITEDADGINIAQTEEPVWMAPPIMPKNE